MLRDATKDEIDSARKEYQTDTIQIDNDALAAMVADGVWIAGWFWLAKEETC